jgi:hypothetical protein
MAWCCGDGSWPAWGLWWLVPLIGIALCITMCLLFRPRIVGRRFCCWGDMSTGEIDGMKKDIQDMKDTIKKIQPN